LGAQLVLKAGSAHCLTVVMVHPAIIIMVLLSETEKPGSLTC
jgi:hypothetical protein